MTVTPVALTDAIPLLTNPGGAGQNNALDIRRGLIVPIFQGGSTADEFVARQGVLVRGVTNPSMKVSQNTSPDRNIRIFGGTAVVNRTSEGSYLVHMATATSTILTDTADPTNPVVEAVVCRLYDKNIAADSGASFHGPYFDVIRGVPGASLNLNGTPGSAGGPPVLPDGAMLLAYISRDAGSPGDTITDAKITDKRKSTELHGGTRLMLSGDSASDTGVNLGESRRRLISGVVQPAEYWGADNKWHGTAPLVYAGVPVSTSGTKTATGGTVHTWGQIDVPDLGYDYKVTFGCHLQMSGLSSTGNYVEGWVRADNATSGTVLASGSAVCVSGLDAPLSLPHYRVTTVAAGTAKTFYFTARPNVTGNWSWTSTDNGFCAHVVPFIS